jgi:hypothetical protein
MFGCDAVFVAVAQPTPIIAKCIFAAFAFFVTRYAWNLKNGLSFFSFQQSLLWAGVLIILVLELDWLFKSGRIPVTNLAYEVAEMSGELGLFLGFCFGLIARKLTGKSSKNGRAADYRSSLVIH